MWYYFLYKDECFARFSYLHECTFNPFLGWLFGPRFEWAGGGKFVPYLKFKLRKARATKLYNYIHHHVCFQNIYKDFRWLQHFTDDVIKYRLHYRTQLWNPISCKFLKSSHKKNVFHSSFWHIKGKYITYFHCKLVDVNLCDRKFFWKFL